MSVQAGRVQGSVLPPFIETHELSGPETLPWPELDPAALARRRGVPFWQEVYPAERRAGAPTIKTRR